MTTKEQTLREQIQKILQKKACLNYGYAQFIAEEILALLSPPATEGQLTAEMADEIISHVRHFHWEKCECPLCSGLAILKRIAGGA